jgi:hypothetical protein
MPPPRLRYKTGQVPQFGDLVRGVPNNSLETISGIVTTQSDGVIRVAYFKLGSENPEVVSVYGYAQHFDMLARNTAEG